ncbi:hypothetical protein EXN66_Car002416 [Channa argus]|uniref:Uncharacterized protein n=1 Tax=Channa argus TaxID=215402 RepID=A0A6G1P9E3_CHAAH|nr:hypothetical protein EXN66_Car002416 [Channa argus]
MEAGADASPQQHPRRKPVVHGLEDQKKCSFSLLGVVFRTTYVIILVNIQLLSHFKSTGLTGNSGAQVWFLGSKSKSVLLMLLDCKVLNLNSEVTDQAFVAVCDEQRLKQFGKLCYTNRVSGFAPLYVLLVAHTDLITYASQGSAIARGKRGNPMGCRYRDIGKWKEKAHSFVSNLNGHVWTSSGCCIKLISPLWLRVNIVEEGNGNALRDTKGSEAAIAAAIMAVFSVKSRVFIELDSAVMTEEDTSLSKQKKKEKAAELGEFCILGPSVSVCVLEYKWWSRKKIKSLARSEEEDMDVKSAALSAGEIEFHLDESRTIQQEWK